MSRDKSFEFVSTDAGALTARLLETYERTTGRVMTPGSPERLLAAWLSAALLQERLDMNYIGNQNLPGQATGEDLDALGEWIYNVKRKDAQRAFCSMRFVLSEPRPSAIPIPRGTRVTDSSARLYWETTADALIPAGETEQEVMVQCTEAGAQGNGFLAGQINTLVDVGNIPFFSFCANVSESAGGGDAEEDEAYLARCIASLDGYSTAGAAGAYQYHARSVSDDIADVRVVQRRGVVSQVVNVYESDNGERIAFPTRGSVIADTLEVSAVGSTTPAIQGTDWEAQRRGDMTLAVIPPGGALAAADRVRLRYTTVQAGCVSIYVLMKDGTPANETIKAAVEQACSGEYERPLTDLVEVDDPLHATYAIDFTYYIDRETDRALADIEAGVAAAVEEYIRWQSGRLGRNINPDKLRELLFDAGVLRVVMRNPVYTTINSGDAAYQIPMLAQCTGVTVINGGFANS